MQHTPIVELDHISMPVRDFKKARRFYDEALGAIGMKANLELKTSCGYGSKDQKIFWLVRDPKASGSGHYAFRVQHTDEVDAFYEAALASGGEDNGPPGPRPDYGPNYYAAFVRDPEGNNIEVGLLHARAGADAPQAVLSAHPSRSRFRARE